MVFKRRDKLGLWERLRQTVWPRTGWRRGFKYLGHRVKRIPDTPHRIALGFAMGAFVSFSPFFGFHFVYAALLAWIFRGNIIAGLIGTAVGNPFTFPGIAAASLGLGRWILARGSADESSFEEIYHAFGEAFSGIWQTIQSWFGYGPSAMDRLMDFFNEVFLPYFVGGIFTGAACAVVCYFVLRPIVAAYQAHRRNRLMARARQTVKQHMQPMAIKPDPAE